MDTAKEIINIIKEISAILGPFIGAIIGYIIAVKTLKKQLSHDSSEREKERKTTTRKEVYLQAVENLYKANSYLGSLSNIDLQKTNIANGFQDLFMSFSKMCLIAEEETVKYVTELSIIYNQIIVNIVPQIMELNKLKNIIDIEDKLYNENQLEIKIILEKMREYNENQDKNIAKFKVLEKNYNFEQGESQKHHINRQQTAKEHIKKNMLFLKQITEESTRISPLISKLLVNLRRELEVDTNIDLFNQIFKQQEYKNNQELNKFMDYISNQLKEF